jgi:hypothetical protein
MNTAKYDPNKDPAIIQRVEQNAKLTERYGPTKTWYGDTKSVKEIIEMVIKAMTTAKKRLENSIRLYDCDMGSTMTPEIHVALTGEGFIVGPRIDIWHDELDCVENSYWVLGF